MANPTTVLACKTWLRTPGWIKGKRLRGPFSFGLSLLGYLAWLVGEQPGPPIPEIVFDDIQMLNYYPGLRSALLVLLSLSFALGQWLCQIINRVPEFVRPWLHEFVLATISSELHDKTKRVAYVSEYNAALLENLRLVVIVHVKLGEQYLVLVFGEGSLRTVSNDLFCWNRRQFLP